MRVVLGERCCGKLAGRGLPHARAPPSATQANARLPPCLRPPTPRAQSFSATGSLEAAWYRETGNATLLSEQHMVDCAWEVNNHGCYGARVRGPPPAPLPPLLARLGGGREVQRAASSPTRLTRRPRLPPRAHVVPGGDQIRAFHWVLDRGGLATAEAYPYRGINDYCRKGMTEAKFSGKLVLVEGGEEALKEALVSRGPMTVSGARRCPAVWLDLQN